MRHSQVWKKQTTLGSILILFLVLPSFALAQPTQISVAVKKTSIRADRQFHAPSLITVHFAEQLKVITLENSWYRVNHKKIEGWVHSSAVSDAAAGKSTSSKMLSETGNTLGKLSGKSSSSNKQGYTEDEVALAGKGFNDGVEKQYQKRHPKADFQAVDNLEKKETDQIKATQFAEAGQLQSRKMAAAPKKEESGIGSTLKSLFN